MDISLAARISDGLMAQVPAYVRPTRRLSLLSAVLAGFTLLQAGLATARPAATASPPGLGRGSVFIGFSTQERRPRFALEEDTREALDGSIALALPAGMGVWIDAGASRAWSREGSSWRLTDLEFGPSWGESRQWDQVDLAGWLTVAASAGDTPERDPWYGGLGDWSFGVGARAAVRVLERDLPAPLWVGFDLRYRSQGRSGWIYLPHNSVAISDSAGVVNGAVVTWQARVEFRGERACLATVLLREEILDSSAMLAGREKPLYLIQSAGLRLWRGMGVAIGGEFMLSGDDIETEFSARSVLPSWGVRFGLSWTFSPRSMPRRGDLSAQIRR